MSYGKPRVHLMTLSVRTSGKGNAYLAGWLGKASVVAFAGEPDKFGNPTWNVFLAERGERQERGQDASRSPRPSSHAGEAPGGRSGHRRQSNGSRRDQAAREVAARYGMADDPERRNPLRMTTLMKDSST